MPFEGKLRALAPSERGDQGTSFLLIDNSVSFRETKKPLDDESSGGQSIDLWEQKK
jgi:hypothetical protein